jgi:hypothetical protein
LIPFDTFHLFFFLLNKKKPNSIISTLTTAPHIKAFRQRRVPCTAASCFLAEPSCRLHD